MRLNCAICSAILGLVLLGLSADVVFAGGRQGGEVIQDATPIFSLRFADNGSTAGMDDDYDVACPDSSSAPDAVYSYTNNGEQASETLDIAVCSDTYDPKLFVYAQGNSLGGIELIACNQDAPCSDRRTALGSRIEGLQVHPGRTIYIVVDGDHGESGSYSLSVDFQPGACCLPSGACVMTLQGDCSSQSGIWRGPGVACAPNPCAPLSGACCFRNAFCRILPAVRCLALRGQYQGNGSVCTPDPCRPSAARGNAPDGGDPPAVPPSPASQAATWGRIKSIYR